MPLKKKKGYLLTTDAPCSVPEIGALGTKFRAGRLTTTEQRLYQDHAALCARCSVEARNARVLTELQLRPEDAERAHELGLTLVKVAAPHCANTRQIAARIRSFRK